MTEPAPAATFATFHAAMQRIAAAERKRTEIMLKFTRRVLERLDGSTPATVRCPEESPAVTAVRKWLVDVQVSQATPEPEVGSDAWFLRRKALWDQNAHDLMAALVRYEDEHPAVAICLAPVLDAARATVPRG